MTVEGELRINARGLSAPGPRLMVESALEKQHPGIVRVVVSSDEGARDVSGYLTGRGASVEIDQVGAEFHVIARFSASE
ncbi:MAG TPA: sulfurtransferase TusA family protein [Candidatus Krumholzibacteria bacterium]|nr:sulfurtransferase TusA family protein [Candidatus Krumholzibacteria bacterium]